MKKPDFRGRAVVMFAMLALALSLAAACGSSSRNGYADGTNGNGNGNGGDGLGGDGGNGTFGNGGGSEAGLDGNFVSAPVCADAECSCTGAGGMWDSNAKTCTLVEGSGNVDTGTQGKLAGGGTGDGAFKFLYPYDATVFPRGLLAPTLQFGGSAPDAVLVHITSAAMDYKGWFGKSNPGRAAPSTAAWNAITYAAKANEQVKVDVTKISGGSVAGPITEHWTVAQGSLRGIIYYETYGSAILGGFASVGIMKISPGATAPTPVASGCGNVCHTASADGSTLVSASGFAGISSVSYNLKGTFGTRKQQGDQSFVYGGLFPNGSIVMSATNYRTWTGGASHLYDTTSGAKLAAPGWDGVVTNAAMPAFSPDGKKIVFNHEDSGKGHSLATMNFAAGANTFSGLVDVVNDPASYLGWPAFTADANTVVYHAGTNDAFETDATDEAGVPSMADLYAVDLATKTKVRLDKLDGYTSGSTSYLPANDPNLNFAPTVLPEAVGGYFWVVFTSHRSYGNTLASKENSDQNGHLWVAAIDIGAAPGTDASHPAFYLGGQEDSADNLRGFWVLDPCRDDGQGCASGDDCCGGYCRPSDNGQLACSSTPPPCANEYEKCTQASDCCGTGFLCINGKCASPPVK